MWNVYDKTGKTIRCTVDKLEYNGTWMGEVYVTATIKSHAPIDFAIGDYLIYRGERFEINYDPTKLKKSSRASVGDAFTYSNIKFNSLSDELTRCQFLDIVKEDNQIHYTSLPKFSFFAATIQDFADRIQANLDRVYTGEKAWRVEVHPEYVNKTNVNISVTNIDIWGALELVVSEFKAYFIIRDRVITIGTAGIPTNKIFKYGKGNGLYEIEQSADSSQQIITRLRAYGNTTNLPTRYYADLYKIPSAKVASFEDIKEPMYGKGSVESEFLYIVTDSPYNRAALYTDCPIPNRDVLSFLVSVTLDGVTINAAAINSGDDNKLALITGAYTAIYNDTVVQAYHNTTATLNAFKAKLRNGASLHFEDGIRKSSWLGSWDYTAKKLPNNMAVRNLMLPGFPDETLDPYIDSDNVSEFGVREATVFFDGTTDELEDIHPTLKGMTAEQLQAANVPITLPSGDNGNLDEVVSAEQIEDEGLVPLGKTEYKFPDFKITIKDIGFDINKYLTTETAVISMKDGMCGGREFEISQCKKVGINYELTCKRVDDSDLDIVFPNKYYNIKPGDKFVLLHIEMPDVYIKAASQRLLNAAKEYLAKNDYTRYTYSPKVDEIYMARQHDEAAASNGVITSLHDTIKEGNIMLFEDSDFNISGSVVIDNITIKEGDKAIPTYTVTLREEKTPGTIQKMQKQLDSIVSGGGQGSGGYTSKQISSIVETVGRELFLSKTEDDTAKGSLTFEKVAKFVARLMLGSEYELDSDGRARLAEVFVRRVMSSEVFRNGFAGEGWQINVDDANVSTLEVDNLVVRRVMSVFELLINKIRSVGGQIVVSAANGKIKEVRDGDTDTDLAGENPGTWFVSFETDNEFVVGDYVRCARWSNGQQIHGYWVEVDEIHTINGTTYICLPKDAFTSGMTTPEVGDEVVLMGSSIASRANMIAISATEDGKPRIDIMDGVTTIGDLSGCLRARLGSLDGLVDPAFPKGIKGHGLYSDNAYLKGDFVLSTGENIATKFEVIEGSVRSAVEALRTDLDPQNILTNPTFNTFAGWETNASSESGGHTVETFEEDGRRVLRLIKGSTSNYAYVRQYTKDFNLANVVFSRDDESNIIPKDIRVTFFVKANAPGRFMVRMLDKGRTQFPNFELNFTAATDEFKQYTILGSYAREGTLIIATTGDISIYGLRMYVDEAASLESKHSTLFNQTADIIQLVANMKKSDGTLIKQSEIFVKPDSAGLVTVDASGNIASIGTYENGVVKIGGAEIQLSGAITANGNVSIDEQGQITATGAMIQGDIRAQSIRFPMAILPSNQTHRDRYIDLNRYGCNLNVEDIQSNERLFLPVGAQYDGMEVSIYNGAYLTQLAGNKGVCVSCKEQNFLNTANASVMNTFYVPSGAMARLRCVRRKDATISSVNYFYQWFILNPTDAAFATIEKIDTEPLIPYDPNTDAETP